MLEGKVVNGYWEPGRLNRILGRQLECGQEAWYVRSARNVGEFTSYAFRYFILGKKYNIEFMAEVASAVRTQSTPNATLRDRALSGST